MRQLAQLTTQVRQAPPRSESRAIALTELVEVLMKTSPICRRRPGQILEGIYLDIFQATKRHLRWQIESKIDQDNPRLIPVTDWLLAMRESAFQKVLEKDQLQQLAIEAQSHSGQTQAEQWRALTELINAIRLSGKLLNRGNYPLDIYEDALNRTLLFVAQNLDTYNPNKGEFMAWVNYRFSRLLQETQSELKDTLIRSQNSLLIRQKYKLNALIQKVGKSGMIGWWELSLKSSRTDKYPALQLSWILLLMLALYQLKQREKIRADLLLREMAKASLDSLIFSQVSGESLAINELGEVAEKPLLSQQVREYLSSDPERLCQKHIRGHSSATFQAITLAYLDGQSWKEISEHFHLGVSAVKNFFQRRLKEIAPSIKSYVQGEL